jgi:prepilin-type processing-associated H-X9-DG protein
MDSAYPYIKSTQIFICPSDALNEEYIYNPPGIGTVPSSPTTGSTAYGSYTMNASSSGIGGLGGPGQETVMKLSAVSAPTTTLWVMDGFTGTSNNIFNVQRFVGALTQTINTTAMPRTIQTTTQHSASIPERHLETTNALFCDGHVKALKLTTIITKNAAGDRVPMLTVDED